MVGILSNNDQKLEDGNYKKKYYWNIERNSRPRNKLMEVTPIWWTLVLLTVVCFVTSRRSQHAEKSMQAQYMSYV